MTGEPGSKHSMSHNHRVQSHLLVLSEQLERAWGTAGKPAAGSEYWLLFLPQFPVDMHPGRQPGCWLNWCSLPPPWHTRVEFPAAAHLKHEPVRMDGLFP